MRVDILTLFPAAFAGPLDVSIIGRARREGLLDLYLHDIRDYAEDRHRSVDDYPAGGGQGMVMRVDVLVRALEAVTVLAEEHPHVIYLSPQGQRLDDRLVRELAACPRLMLVAGRYEGVDERFIEGWVDREVSIGDYILTGGELPAMVLVDAVARHIPGALGDAESARDESFVDGLLEHPQYTRPGSFRGREIPAVLQSGDHAAIERWKHAQRLLRTAQRRPDLLGDRDPGRPERKAAGGVKVGTGRFPDDYEQVLALWRASGTEIQLQSSDEPAEMARKMTRDPDLFLVAASGKRLVGAVLGGWDGRWGYVYKLAVAADRQHSGIGRAVMAELEARFALKGCGRMNLVIADGASTAVGFYERLGWRQSTAVLMTKDVVLHTSGRTFH